MNNVRVCFGWTADDGRDRVIRFKRRDNGTVYVHVIDGLGSVPILSSDGFLGGELYVNAMPGDGWIVDKPHSGYRAHSPASPTSPTMALGLFRRHAAF